MFQRNSVFSSSPLPSRRSGSVGLWSPVPSSGNPEGQHQGTGGEHRAPLESTSLSRDRLRLPIPSILKLHPFLGDASGGSGGKRGGGVPCCLPEAAGWSQGRTMLSGDGSGSALPAEQRFPGSGSSLTWTSTGPRRHPASCRRARRCTAAHSCRRYPRPCGQRLPLRPAHIAAAAASLPPPSRGHVSAPPAAAASRRPVPGSAAARSAPGTAAGTRCRDTLAPAAPAGYPAGSSSPPKPHRLVPFALFSLFFLTLLLKNPPPPLPIELG